MWAIRDGKEPACPRDDGAGPAFVLSVVHREVGVDAGEVSMMLVHATMLQAAENAVAVAVSGW